MRDFKDLQIWQKSVEIYKMTVDDAHKFPRNRIAYNIFDQFLRSLGSISANIAEGFGRGSDRELQRFCIIARGSIDESRDWIYKINELRYLKVERVQEYDEKFIEIRKMLNVFISKVRVRIKAS